MSLFKVEIAELFKLLTDKSPDNVLFNVFAVTCKAQLLAENLAYGNRAGILMLIA